jgi:YegS/Rv2252/BmrU family lipid kinase
MTEGHTSTARRDPATLRPERAALIVNARSRAGEAAFTRARALLPALGVPLAAAHAVRHPAALPETVARALDAGCDLVILGGGDGSVSSAVDLLAHRHATLGLLPVGTANDFARTLGIPPEIRAACAVIAEGTVVDVDLGCAGGDYYVNVATVGLGATVSRLLTPGIKRRLGALAYPAGALGAYLRHEPFTARLTFPRGDHAPIESHRLLQVAVGNGRFYGGGNVVAPAAGIDDRALDVYALELGPLRELLRVLRHFRSGAFVRSGLVHNVRTTAVRLETDPPKHLNIDGELAGRTPETFTLAPNALRVLAPRHSPAARLDRPTAHTEPFNRAPSPRP